jgi:hypothetical protein
VATAGADVLSDRLAFQYSLYANGAGEADDVIEVTLTMAADRYGAIGVAKIAWTVRYSSRSRTPRSAPCV